LGSEKTNNPKSGSDPSILDRALRILHVEDDPNDRNLVQSWLTAQNIAAEFTNIDNEVDFVRAVERGTFDIVLSDKSLPGFDGLVALRLVRDKHPNIPFVFVTGSMGEEAAIETIKLGATDYVLKDRLSRLIPAVLRAIREAEQEEKNRRIEEQIRQQAALLDKAQDAILVTDVEDRIQYWNKSAERIYGWPADQAQGRKAREILSVDPARFEEARQRMLERGAWNGELTKVNRGGNRVTVESHWTLVRDDDGNPKSVFIIDTDITEKKALEAKFLRAQRVDSIGALAGGIAHDLNNALAPVLISSELLRMSGGDEDREKFVDIIQSNAQRATELVKQILSFARGSESEHGPVPVKHLVREMGKMIQDTFPKSISFSATLPAEELWTVPGDSTELHQVLLNLCVNARDAMPQGGKLTVTAQNITVDEITAAANGAKPGFYVMISVADTGTGIPLEVLPRIFEPFFTTKQGDQGTGLGLATVAGIIKHHSGFMQVETASGQGTEFKTFFPAVTSAPPAEEASPKPELPSGHGELILLIDDEEALLELTKTMLVSFGYQVVTAQNGLAGVAQFRENLAEIKLLVTDSDMPHMDGMGVIRAVKELKPGIPVIMASGTRKEPRELAPGDPLEIRSLQKPYSLDTLLAAIDSALRN